MSAPGPSAPSLVDLAHAAEQAIARYAYAADRAVVAVRKGDVSLDGIDIASSEASLAVTRVRLRGKVRGDDGEELSGMATLLARGIVRPEWGLRVVAIATAAQAGKAASDG